MTKEQAAEYLGVSVRTLQRYTQEHRVQVAYIKGKRGQEAVYDPAELERFKAELEAAPSHVKPSVAGVAGDAREQSTALAPIQSSEVIDRLAKALEAFRDSGKPDHAPLADLAVKMVLTVQEAAALSGLSRRTLAEAIHAGKLHAPRIGKGFKIRRADLERFVDSLFPLFAGNCDNG